MQVSLLEIPISALAICRIAAGRDHANSGNGSMPVAPTTPHLFLGFIKRAKPRDRYEIE